jgi:hypothetical protein
VSGPCFNGLKSFLAEDTGQMSLDGSGGGGCAVVLIEILKI